ncbi:tetratricopeptide repeat protein [Actinomadura madurae]|uniref:tetratricopeptide repeat protein n=1 Tax=Actinomadura madurae TaxID=1993 RepID=UPI0020D23470|nr:tetratricopeptide repeat protein [Actinomadura madurae]MCQ0021518.1 tetratricopeptide repeat protein [Actinomadura madurae]
MLTTERDAVPDDLDDAVTAFLALALTDVGREREAVSLALGALSRHLPRYNRSLAAYAEALTQEKPR